MILKKDWTLQWVPASPRYAGMIPLRLAVERSTTTSPRYAGMILVPKKAGPMYMASPRYAGMIPMKYVTLKDGWTSPRYAGMIQSRPSK